MVQVDMIEELGGTILTNGGYGTTFARAIVRTRKDVPPNDRVELVEALPSLRATTQKLKLVCTLNMMDASTYSIKVEGTMMDELAWDLKVCV
ncbi:hypothetical protein U1Q18_024510 [Sarracenia purpurea var. burkii]